MKPRHKQFQDVIRPYTKSKSRNCIQQLFTSAINRSKNLIRIDINGTIFVLPYSICIRIPLLQNILTRRAHPLNVKHSNSRQMEPLLPTCELLPVQELFFERNSTIFAAVVDYVQNYELHVPPDVCPKLYAREIAFWGFDLEEVEPCCFSSVVHFLHVQDKLNQFHGIVLNKQKASSKDNFKLKNGKMTLYQKCRQVIWNILNEPFNSKEAQVYFWALFCTIMTSYFAIAAETLDYVKTSYHKTDPNTPVHIVEYICSTILYLDFLLRVMCHPHPTHFFNDIVNVTDGLAVVTSILKTVVEFEELHIDNDLFNFINMMQLLRILRLLRPMSKLIGFRLIYFTLKSSLHELMLIIMMLMFLTMIFSSLLYYVDDGDAIKSIPHAMWYTLTTMTTVGYGDIVPVQGKTMIIGAVIAIFGVVMLSITTPIMVSNFHSLYINALVGLPYELKQSHSKHRNQRNSLMAFRKHITRKFSVRPLLTPIWKTNVVKLDSRKSLAPDDARRAGRPFRFMSLVNRVQPQPRSKWNGLLSFGQRKEIKTTTEPLPTIVTDLAHEDAGGEETGNEADEELKENILSQSETSETDSEGISKARKERFNELIKPRHRTWFANYETSDSDSENAIGRRETVLK